MMATTNQENNQLLNAIRNKFAQSESETASFSPPKFKIPQLKNSGNSPLSSPNQNEGSHLNKFILGQINASQTTITANGVAAAGVGGFVLPKLQFAANYSAVHPSKGETNFVIPMLKNGGVGPPSVSCSFPSQISSNCTTNTSISSLSNDLQNKLHVDGDKTTTQPIIDLTTALADSQTKMQATFAAANAKNNKASGAATFHIPFIECDRANPAAMNALYCQLDISQMQWKHSLSTPSNCGRIFCDQSTKAAAKAILLLSSKPSSLGRIRKVKHQIKRFNFETLSPDDKVLATLNKYQRVR